MELMLKLKLFQCLVHQIAMEVAGPDAGDPLHWQPACIQALCETTDVFLDQEFECK